MATLPKTLGTQEGFRAHLALLLESIEANDLNDPVRQALVIHALSIALRAGLQAGIRVDPAELQRPVCFIELGEFGQVSWHLQEHYMPWDGHDTETKYARCRAFIDSCH